MKAFQELTETNSQLLIKVNENSYEEIQREFYNQVIKMESRIDQLL